MLAYYRLDGAIIVRHTGRLTFFVRIIMFRYIKFQRVIIVTAVTALASVTMALPATSAPSQNYQRFSKKFLTKGRKRPVNHIELLFVQQTDKAQMTMINDSKCMTLTLTGLARGLHYFTDQPRRMAGQLSTADFLKVWHKQDQVDSGFRPNVAIQGQGLSAHNASSTYDEVAELSRPMYNAARNDLTYKACPLQGQSLAMAKTLKNVTIFYDQFSQWPP
jgi:hypothetical protein